MPSVATRVSFVTEQHVGLRTYSENLRRFIDEDERLVPSWRPLTYHQEGGVVERFRFLPSAIRAFTRGRLQVRKALSDTAPEAVLYLTQVPAAIGGRPVREVPYVVILDDTPVLYDAMCHHYGEGPTRLAPLRWWKHWVNTRALRAAVGLYPMSTWARRSLLDDYGVDESKVHVLPTGIDLDAWRAGDGSDDGIVRILFVGGNLQRKGGDDLVAAFQRLEPGSAELHLVTRTDVESSTGIHVHHDMEPNSERLRALFRSSDVFVLPSRAEAFPNVVVEASASGLPAIVTRVGGMEEMVVDGVTGYVLDAGDIDALSDRLRDLVEDADTRSRMSVAARQLAEERYDGRRNAEVIATALVAAARR